MDSDAGPLVGCSRVCDWGQGQGARQARTTGADRRGPINTKPRWQENQRGFVESLGVLFRADGYYQWRKEGNRKQPYYFRLRSGDPMFLAGVMAVRNYQDGRHDATFAIIVGPADHLAAPIHDRMPAFLDQEARKLWLAPDTHDTVKLSSILQHAPSDFMECYAVSATVNSRRNKVSDCIRPQQA